MPRIPLDAYYTEPALARRLVALLPLEQGDIVLEPHVGGGAFIDALIARTGTTPLVLVAADVDADAPGLCRPGVEQMPGFDFLSELLSPEDGISWVVGNPPFNHAQLHVEEALRIAKKGVGFLLRLAFLESATREAFWKKNPPACVYVLTRRPTFTGDGRTDSCAYGFFVWQKGQQEADPRIRFLTGNDEKE